jgi:hypothetical protein
VRFAQSIAGVLLKTSTYGGVLSDQPYMWPSRQMQVIAAAVDHKSLPPPVPPPDHHIVMEARFNADESGPSQYHVSTPRTTRRG